MSSLFDALSWNISVLLSLLGLTPSSGLPFSLPPSLPSSPLLSLFLTVFLSFHMYFVSYAWASQVAQLVENPPTMLEMQERRVRSLGWEDPLEEGMATHSSILAWRIPWTEEPVGYSPQGCTELDTAEATRQQQQWIRAAD